MSAINFKAKVSKISSMTLVRLPKSESDKLPSRGLTLVEGNINGFAFITPLEPDGKGSHWMYLDSAMQKATNLKKGDTATIEMESSKDWFEPKIPEDLKSALKADTEANQLWNDITILARWDWIRWIRSTKNAETRKKRIEVTFSKLKSGKRAACCFNRSECTVPDVSKSGVLMEPN